MGRIKNKILTVYSKSDLIVITCLVLAILIIFIYIGYEINTDPQYGLKGLQTGFNNAGYNIENIEFVRTQKLFVFRASEPIVYKKDGNKYEYWKVESYQWSTFRPPMYVIYPYANDIKPADWN